MEILKEYLRPLTLSKKIYREHKIRFTQERLIAKAYPKATENLIVFLTPGDDYVSGGILSISSIFQETVKLKHIHNAEVILCTMPGDPSLLKYTKFENSNIMYRFSQVLSHFRNLKSLMIHIPECFIGYFLKNVSKENLLALKKISSLHMNVMLQNIELLTEIDSKELLDYGRLTYTTAHEQYTSLEMRQKLGVPLHKFSTFVSPGFYNRKVYVQKEDILIVSPDEHQRKQEILDLIIRNFPKLKIRIIKSMSYEEYKKFLTRAKWALTFGEGLDGYFVETIFSGGIGFAVYNEKFFTKDFSSLPTVYGSFDELVQKICFDIRELDNDEKYAASQHRQFELCAKYYNFNEYIDNLEKFYKGEYTYK